MPSHKSNFFIYFKIKLPKICLIISQYQKQQGKFKLFVYVKLYAGNVIVMNYQTFVEKVIHKNTNESNKD